jgi:hypothetical protein
LSIADRIAFSLISRIAISSIRVHLLGRAGVVERVVVDVEKGFDEVTWLESVVQLINPYPSSPPDFYHDGEDSFKHVSMILISASIASQSPSLLHSLISTGECGTCQFVEMDLTSFGLALDLRRYEGKGSMSILYP